MNVGRMSSRASTAVAGLGDQDTPHPTEPSNSAQNHRRTYPNGVSKAAGHFHQAIHESVTHGLQKQHDLMEKLERLSPSQRSKPIAALQKRITEDIGQEDDDLDEALQELLWDEYTSASWNFPRSRDRAQRPSFPLPIVGLTREINFRRAFNFWKETWIFSRCRYMLL